MSNILPSHSTVKYYALLLVGFFLVTSVSCSNSYTGKAKVGAIDVPVLGLPFFTATTSSNVTESGQTQGLVFITILENSLIFKRRQDSLIAKTIINIQFNNSAKKKVVNQAYQMDFVRSADQNYYEQEEIRLHKAFSLSPGKYTVRVAITDLHSGKQSTTQEKLEVPDPDAQDVFISSVRFFQKRNDESPFTAVNGYHVNTGFDSLKFTFQLTNGFTNEPLEIRTKLIKFKADTAPARPMSARKARNSSLIYHGLDYTEKEIIQSSLRNLNTKGNVSIENSFFDLERGNYRFEVDARTESGKQFFEVRDFSIKSINFPQIKTARELARPLVYLMSYKDYNELLQIKSEDSLKSAIDAYWLNNIKNIPKARTIIRMYYERVEQANIQFSNYKEGWKTDPGMIYILFGPPLYTEDGFGEMTWFYEFDSGNSVPSIYFKDSRFGNIKFPFNNFILRRSDDLFGLQYHQIQAWHDGSILSLSQ